MLEFIASVVIGLASGLGVTFGVLTLWAYGERQGWRVPRMSVSRFR